MATATDRAAKKSMRANDCKALENVGKTKRDDNREIETARE